MTATPEPLDETADRLCRAGPPVRGQEVKDRQVGHWQHSDREGRKIHPSLDSYTARAYFPEGSVDSLGSAVRDFAAGVTSKVSTDQQAHVLVVDDDALVRRFTARALGEKVRLDLADSAEQAREFLRSNHYALALVDVYLPGDDGISLLTDIRRQHPGTKILIFTGQPSEAVTRSIIQGKADDYLEKPFTVEQLNEAVERLTATHRPMSRFDEVCNYIRLHLAEDLRLSTVAQRFQMQPSSFSQWFNAEAARRSAAPGYKAFITQARIERAEHLLSTTDMLIKEIAHSVGFSSHQLLNQHFQEKHGVSPSEWRERLGAQG